jgi:hypothetical protein
MIEIHRSKVYRGPHVWTRMPVVHLVVDSGDLEGRPHGP